MVAEAAPPGDAPARACDLVARRISSFVEMAALEPTPAVAPLVDALVELAEKYRLLAALGAEAPGRTPARRDAMREVADRFPGALRELDAVGAAKVACRLEQVEQIAALARRDARAALAALDADDADFIHAGLALHRRLRDHLRLKRLDRRGSVANAAYDDAASSLGWSVARLKAALFPVVVRACDVAPPSEGSGHGT